MEEIGRFENFDVDLVFTPEEWYSFSKSLREYILAKRLLSKVSIETNPGSKIDDLDCAKDRRPDLDPEAKRSSDVNVTVRPRASGRVEQETVE